MAAVVLADHEHTLVFRFSVACASNGRHVIAKPIASEMSDGGHMSNPAFEVRRGNDATACDEIAAT